MYIYIFIKTILKGIQSQTQTWNFQQVFNFFISSVQFIRLFDHHIFNLYPNPIKPTREFQVHNDEYMMNNEFDDDNDVDDDDDDKWKMMNEWWCNDDDN